MRHTIEQQIKGTYLALRIGAAVIGFALPVLLWGGGKLAGLSLRESMSAYYWATPAQPCPCGENPDHSCVTSNEITMADKQPADVNLRPPGTMRNWFVGLLFAIGTILYVNQGHTPKENWALNIAGVLALGIALLPMPWDCNKHSLSPHGVCAVSFFVCIAFVSAFCSQNTLALIKDPQVRARYRKAYITLAVIMLASPLAAYVFNLITSQHSHVYWAELFGIYAFALYWSVKTSEMFGPDVKRMLAERREETAV